MLIYSLINPYQPFILILSRATDLGPSKGSCSYSLHHRWWITAIFMPIWIKYRLQKDIGGWGGWGRCLLFVRVYLKKKTGKKTWDVFSMFLLFLWACNEERCWSTLDEGLHSWLSFIPLHMLNMLINLFQMMIRCFLVYLWMIQRLSTSSHVMQSIIL